MGRRILIIVLVLVVALFVYLGYNSYDARRAGVNGEVFSSDSAAGKASRDTADAPSPGSQTIVYPAQTQSPAPAPAGDDSQVPANTAGATTAASGATAGDTISPNPPNGMVFSGSGKYQLYRQGNLTWRLNTDTGQSCILFATDEEWRKPRVIRAACGDR